MSGMLTGSGSIGFCNLCQPTIITALSYLSQIIVSPMTNESFCARNRLKQKISSKPL